jgi:hypothetical protein
MKAVREISTKLISFLFDDEFRVEITDAGLLAPKLAQDIRPETHEVINVPPPPMPFVGGKLIFDEGWDYLNPPVPELVDMAQARLALLHGGITASDVDALIAQMPSPQREAAQIEWEYRPTVRRDSPLVTALGPLLGLTDEQVDDLFRLGFTL